MTTLALADADKPVQDGCLFFNPEQGTAGCANPDCGWSGAPITTGSVKVGPTKYYAGNPDDPTFGPAAHTTIRAEYSTLCPVCEGPDSTAEWKEICQETTHTVVKVGRNDRCPCGSGKKHKKCCGR